MRTNPGLPLVRLTRLKMDAHRASYDASSLVTKCFSYFAFIKSSCAINSGISRNRSGSRNTLIRFPCQIDRFSFLKRRIYYIHSCSSN